MLATLGLCNSLAKYGEVQKVAVWSFVGDETLKGWRGHQPITLNRLRRYGLFRAFWRDEPLSIARFYRPTLAHELSSGIPVDVLVCSHIATWQYARSVRARRPIIYTYNVEA